MRLSVIAVTRHGAALGRRAAGCLRQQGHPVRLLVPARFRDGTPGEEAFSGPLAGVIAAEFERAQGLVLIMALGIVIRLLAPLVRDKRTDPAVVTLDEKGQFVISTLSGHLGGANDLARSLAAGLGAAAVITTATDVRGRPAVDVLARQYDLAMEPFAAVRTVNAALVNGEPVTFCSQFTLPLPQADGIHRLPWEQLRTGRINGWLVLITNRTIAPPAANTLFLRPRNLVAGIGCRRGIDAQPVREALERALALAGCSPLSLQALATVDLRAEEAALQIVAGERAVPLFSFSRAAIQSVYDRKEHNLNFSHFVYEKIGVGGVCEPVSLLTAPRAVLILPKTSHRGVTVALAEVNSGWWEPARAMPRT
ncbi:cobalt-precorrin 5A hydrolase [Desulfotomaculum copahuensis]|nr:cobalt-precorrin 5A hydrolase [Desulfotomaculum copahuensis]